MNTSRSKSGKSQAHAQPAYAELQVTTNFSFLRGGSHAEELVAMGKALGLSAIAITDRNTLAGVARAHLAAREANMRIIVGARLDLSCGASLLCLPRNRAAYGRLSRLLTLGQRRAEKGHCILHLEDVAAHAEGQIFIALAPEGWSWRDAAAAAPQRNMEEFERGGESRNGQVIDFREPGFPESGFSEPGLPEPGLREAGAAAYLAAQPIKSAFEDQLVRLKQALDAPLYLAATHTHRGDDRARIAALARLAEKNDTPLVATGDVLYHASKRRELLDVLTCVREKCTVHEAGRRLGSNAERHLRAPGEMARLFCGFGDAIDRTLEIAQACTFSLDELAYEYPDEPVPPGKTPQGYLEELVADGLDWRFPEGPPARIARDVTRELGLISQLNYAPYFLTVYDIVRFARSQNIFCQGRGSAANSAVCYCLGITNVNPAEIDLLFDRFISPERKEPPDIDVDFEHERREEVIQYIYARYGRDRAGLAATVISYRGRSAVRDVGKALGLSEDILGILAGTVWGYYATGVKGDYIRQAGLDPDDPLLARVLELAGELSGFPRHLSQHVGGFVLTRGPLSEIVPIGNAAMDGRTVIEWDKDDLDALGLLKVDVLGLGMLTCIHRAFDLLEKHYGRKFTLATVPREDPVVYDMLCKADSLGVFQVESRAQMNMLPRLKPRCFYDLVIEVAIVRPGPIQGDMVHPYLRRRDGIEPEIYPAPAPEHGPADELRRVLGKTKGVPLFQEQAMRIAMEAAQFTPGEVNQLRRAMATFRRRGTIHTLEEKMVSRMVARGYDPDFAARCFDQIKGFGEYGFPESHAASFAHLVYISSWLKCHYPEVFAAALLNSQPMGFYAPAQIVRDAREHGVEAREVDVNFSSWDCTLEQVGAGPPGDPSAPGSRPDGRAAPRPALRLGLRQIDGLRQDEAEKIVAARRNRMPAQARNRRLSNAPPCFVSVDELRLGARVQLATLERLAAADAFRSMSLDRRQALWEVRALPAPVSLPLFTWAEASDMGADENVRLPVMPLSEHVVNDYQTLRLSLKAHPMAFLRDRLNGEGVVPAERLRSLRDGARIVIAGVVLVRQRPGSAKGVVFMTIEDETGVANAVVWPKVLEDYRKVVMGARLIVIRGRIQRHEDIIHVVAARLEDRSCWLGLLSEDAAALSDTVGASLAGPPADRLIPPLAHADEVVRPGPHPNSGPNIEPKFGAGVGLSHDQGSWGGSGRAFGRSPGEGGDPSDPVPPDNHAAAGAPGPDPGPDRLPSDPHPSDPRPPHPRWSGANWKPGRHPRDERIVPKSRDFH